MSGVSGVRYVPASDMELLDAAARPGKKPPHVTLLAPLDPFMWDRRLARELFAFEYTWEVYTPIAKRKHGYYVLPVLFGDRLVARIEPRFDRDARLLDVELLRFEPSFPPGARADFLPALDEALLAHSALAGATRVRWRRGVRPKR